jgi:tetratricopeptide (TPR) repeat protein
VTSNEELWLHGRHLEQYRHATYRPEPYYEEALRRDPGDSRCHTALGRLRLMRGAFAEAEEHFRAAVERLTLRNPNPADGEAYYQLGLSLRYQCRFDEAEDAFCKAAWSEAWKSPAFFELARLASRRQAYESALEWITESLHRNGRHAQAGHLRIRILKALGRTEEAAEAAHRCLEEDPLNFRAAGELGRELTAHQCLLLGLDLLHAGFTRDACERFDQASAGEFLAGYVKGWALHLAGEPDASKQAYAEAERQSFAFAFPNLLEAVPALETALELNPEDGLAAYALGNFLYAHRRPEPAIQLWEQCTNAAPEFPTAWRNLGLARMNKQKDAAGAGAALQKAFQADPADARVLYELDQLAKETAADPAERLQRLETYRELCLSRDDLCVEYLNLLNVAGRFAEALDILQSRVFHPWEGGEGKVPAAYVRARIGLAIEAETSGNLEEAKTHLEQAGEWPLNLGEGKLEANTENERWWRLGRVLRAMGDAGTAAAFENATLGDSEPAGAMYYNDQPPENVYFQGLALRDLGREDEATQRFESLTAYAQAHRDDEVTIDYFAVSLPDFLVFDVDLNEKNRRHCLFMAALGCQGLGDEPQRDQMLNELDQVCPDHPVRQMLK